jgi:hypothetical protein
LAGVPSEFENCPLFSTKARGWFLSHSFACLVLSRGSLPANKAMVRKLNIIKKIFLICFIQKGKSTGFLELW